MPGSVSAAPAYAISPSSSTQVHHDRDDGVDSRPVVVEEHERRRSARARRARPPRRSGSTRSRARARRTARPGTSSTPGSAPARSTRREIGGFLLGERPRMAPSPPSIRPLNLRRRLHPSVEDDGELASDVVARQSREPSRRRPGSARRRPRAGCTRPGSVAHFADRAGDVGGRFGPDSRPASPVAGSGVPVTTSVCGGSLPPVACEQRFARGRRPLLDQLPLEQRRGAEDASAHGPCRRRPAAARRSRRLPLPCTAIIGSATPSSLTRRSTVCRACSTVSLRRLASALGDGEGIGAADP